MNIKTKNAATASPIPGQFGVHVGVIVSAVCLSVNGQ